MDDISQLVSHAARKIAGGDNPVAAVRATLKNLRGMLPAEEYETLKSNIFSELGRRGATARKARRRAREAEKERRRAALEQDMADAAMERNDHLLPDDD